MSLSSELLEAVNKGNGKVDFQDPGTKRKFTLFEIVRSPMITDDDLSLILDEARADIACGATGPWPQFIEELRTKIATFGVEADANC